GSTVNFNGNGAQTIPAYSYQNLTCSVSGAKTAAGSFSVGGTLNVASGVSLEMEGFDLSGASLTTSGGGNVVTKSTSATPLPSGRTWSMNVYYTFAGNQTVVSGTYNGSFIAGGGGTKSAAGNLTLNGILSVGSTSTLDMGTSSILLGSPTSIVSPGIIKTAVPTATSSTPFPAGLNWGSVGTVEYAGTAAQTAMAGTYHNLTVTGGGTKTLSGNISVGGTLTFTSGKIDGGTNTLTLTSATPASQISGGSPSSYIYNTGAGRLRRNNLAIGTNNNFPVGSPTYFNPVVVKPLDAVKDFAVSMFEGLNQDGTSTGTPLPNKNPVVNATWNVDLINGDPGNDGAEITLSWNTALEGAAFATFTGPQIGISHFTTGNWQLAVGSGDNTANTATATFDSFSPFAVGKVGTVLPISFTNLKAYEKQRGVQVDWKVTADKNVSTYVVERSADGRNFSKIGTVAANQSDLASSYGFYDAAPLPGTGYYRIASQQKDGSNSLSAVLRVNLNKSIKETIIYPNPVKGGMLSLQSTNLEKGNYSIRMYSVNGQELLQLRFDHNGGAINQMINLPKNLQPGMYDIMLDKAGSRVMSKKVMVQ
ncbi:MAG TPA: T9SS type A sorting domain-containing protein, partial [Phnomibacter sp.]|nr:T9SS type A sorting domain-containing protein [Phnomibacter sp.]